MPGHRGTFALLAGALLATPAAHAAPRLPDIDIELVPHRAVYSMTLQRARPSSGIAGAQGLMVFKFADSCDGWTVENRTEITISYADRPTLKTAWDYVSWEAKDGGSYRFWVSTARNGRVVEEIRGSARADGTGGNATFTSPEQLEMALPKGILFPTRHTVRLLEEAAAGKRLFLSTLFDGTDLEGAAEVNAVIGRYIAAAGRGAVPASQGLGEAAVLLDSPSWKVSLAFFTMEGDDALPDYEVSVRYHANGVGEDITQDFGEFSLHGTLEKLERLPDSGC